MLVPILLNLATPAVELKLKLDKPEIKIGQSPGIHLEIHNKGDMAVKLIHIQDGSAWHWMNPKVGWSLMPINREPIPNTIPKLTTPRCGNMNPLTKESFFTLKKGEKSTLDPSWTFPLQDVAPGEYRLAFHYEISANEPRTRILVPEAPEVNGLYSSLTPVKVRSNTVRIKISP
jgi:hypothetical protein